MWVTLMIEQTVDFNKQKEGTLLFSEYSLADARQTLPKQSSFSDLLSSSLQTTETADNAKVSSQLSAEQSKEQSRVFGTVLETSNDSTLEKEIITNALKETDTDLITTGNLSASDEINTKLNDIAPYNEDSVDSSLEFEKTEDAKAKVHHELTTSETETVLAQDFAEETNEGSHLSRDIGDNVIMTSSDSEKNQIHIAEFGHAPDVIAKRDPENFYSQNSTQSVDESVNPLNQKTVFKPDHKEIAQKDTFTELKKSSVGVSISTNAKMTSSGETAGNNNTNAIQAGSNGQASGGSFNQNSNPQGQAQQQQTIIIKNMMSQTQHDSGIRLNESVSSDSTDLEKAEQLLGSLGGNSVVSRAHLPMSMQSIGYGVKTPQWGQALGQRVVFMAKNGVQEAKITLNPEKLGPVQIKLHVDKEQQLHVSMNAQHGVTREAMENALPRLREMLESSGMNLASVNVGDGHHFDQTESGSDSNTGGKRQNGLDEVADEMDDSSTQQSTVISSDNLVDYYA